MSYDQRLAQRVREALEAQPGVAERQMFGGLAFMIGGHMCCGVTGDDLVARVGPAAYEAALRRAHARPMDLTGRPLTGFVYVGPKGTARRASLRRWVDDALRFVRSLPPK